MVTPSLRPRSSALMGSAATPSVALLQPHLPVAAGVLTTGLVPLAAVLPYQVEDTFRRDMGDLIAFVEAPGYATLPQKIGAGLAAFVLAIALSPLILLVAFLKSLLKDGLLVILPVACVQFVGWRFAPVTWRRCMQLTGYAGTIAGVAIPVVASARKWLSREK